MSSTKKWPLEIRETIPEALTAALAAGLDAFSAPLAPPRDYRPLSVTLGESGDWTAGLAGATYWSWLHIRLLWVAEARRGQGVGAALVGAAEDEARARGCWSALVDTFTFQAVGFYESLGYERFATLADFPPGQQRIYYRKALADGPTL